MSVTLPNMSLSQWNLGTDQFSFSQLAANFLAIDNHDHSSGKGVQVPAAGILNGAVTNAKLGANAVDSTKILDGSVADADLASPNNGVLNLLSRVSTVIPSSTTNGTLLFTQQGSIAAQGLDITGVVPVFNLTAANFSVGGKTTKLVMKGTVVQNGITSAISSLTLGLYPISAVGGAADLIHWTTGTVVSGSTVAFGTPAINTAATVTTADFTFPSDGTYALAVALGSIPAAGSRTAIIGSLWIHAV